MSETTEALLQNTQGEYLPQHRDPTTNGGTGSWETNKGEDGALYMRTKDGHFVAVTGTVTANQGGAPWSVQLTGSNVVEVEDGGNVSLGATTDAAATTDTGSFSLIALFKRLLSKVEAFFNRLQNTEGTLLASAARTATTSSPDQTSHNARGVIVTINVTAASGTGGLTVRIAAKDPASGAYSYMNTAPTAVTTATRLMYVLYPGASNTAVSTGVGQTLSLPLPRTWRVEVVHGDASSYTYSLSYQYIV